MGKRQKTKIWHAIANNMSTNIRLSKAQLSKIIQKTKKSKKAPLKFAVPLAEVILPELVFKETSSIIYFFSTLQTKR